MKIRLERGEDPLEVAILKWQDIVRGIGKDFKDRNCALCEMYIRKMCKDCPIQIANVSDAIGCEETPYADYCNASTAEARKEAAKREVEFLKSLRKK